jgi:hypothetical protein
MKRFISLIVLILSFNIQAQVVPPAGLSVDPYADRVTAWLKKNPRIYQCADSAVNRLVEDRNAIVTPQEYAQIVAVCSSFRAADPRSAMLGEELDYMWYVKPHDQKQSTERKAGRRWQDVDGYLHFPDGTVSSSPM